jgi:hypothetical protein
LAKLTVTALASKARIRIAFLKIILTLPWRMMLAICFIVAFT